MSTVRWLVIVVLIDFPVYFDEAVEVGAMGHTHLGTHEGVANASHRSRPW